MPSLCHIRMRYESEAGSITEGKQTNGTVIDKNTPRQNVSADKRVEPLSVEEFVLCNRCGKHLKWQGLRARYNDADIVLVTHRWRHTCGGSMNSDSSSRLDSESGQHHGVHATPACSGVNKRTNSLGSRNWLLRLSQCCRSAPLTPMKTSTIGPAAEICSVKKGMD